MAKRHKVRWTDLARADLREALAFTREYSPQRSRELSRVARETARRLGTLPKLGSVARDLEPRGMYRHVVLGDYYRLIYLIDEEENAVVIIRFWDGRRDPESLTTPIQGAKR